MSTPVSEQAQMSNTIGRVVPALQPNSRKRWGRSQTLSKAVIVGVYVNISVAAHGLGASFSETSIYDHFPGQ
ncbi:hypothetical protein CC78DRAFT_535180 [Lojkania enalia]|uniref:Uncharacterized protein n=1 Tax=Lojkania enalia TaxID=147567 RepID=A0A9P4K508_9PLEO|nr:hypothetical protein CC78DRAFT_535180 [Didymosphaeria enalia]